MSVLELQFAQRADTAANWTTSNPIPLAGELCWESDTGYWKVGDGTSTWTALPYNTMFQQKGAGGRSIVAGSNSTGALLTGNDSVIIGYGTAPLATAVSDSNIIGANAGAALLTGDSNNLYGNDAGSYLTTGADNCFFGVYAGGEIETGSSNVAMGNYAAEYMEAESSGNVVIGDRTGPTSTDTFNNELWIHNEQDDDPLIWGDFSGRAIKINGTLQVENHLFAGALSNQFLHIQALNDLDAGLYLKNSANTGMGGFHASSTNVGIFAGDTVDPFISYRNGDIHLHVQNTGDVWVWDESAGTHTFYVNSGSSKDRIVELVAHDLRVYSAASQVAGEFDTSIHQIRAGSGVINQASVSIEADGTGRPFLQMIQGIDVKGYFEWDNTNARWEFFSDSTFMFAPSNAETFEFSTTQLTAGNYLFDIDQTVGVSEDGYVLTYANGDGQISLEAANNHTHPYLPLTGGTLTGDLVIDNANPLLDLIADAANPASIRIAANALTAGTTSFDIQQDAAGAAYIWQRNNQNMFIGVNGVTAITVSTAQNVTMAGELWVEDSFTLNGPNPIYRVIEDDAGVDQGRWRLQAQGEAFYLRLENDAVTSTRNAISVSRSGTGASLNVDTITTYSDNVAFFNGDETANRFYFSVDNDSPNLIINGADTGSPYIQWQQNGVQKAYAQYRDSGGEFWLDADGDIHLRPFSLNTYIFSTATLTAGNYVFDVDQAVGVGQDNYVLTYDNGTGLISLEAAAGGGASQLSDLTDVNTSTPTNRNVLVADGVDWESRALTEADISDLGSYLPLAGGTLTGPLVLSATTISLETGRQLYLDTDNDTYIYANADDVIQLVAGGTAVAVFNGASFIATNYNFDVNQVVGASEDNYVLTYDHSTTQIRLEAAAAGGATQLSELSDVNTSTPTNRNVLIADGVDWESRALVEADIPNLSASKITSSTFADARIAQSNVTQHQAALGTTANTASTIVRRDASGYIRAQFYNSSNSAENGTATHYWYESSSDGWIRKKTLANVRTEIVNEASVTAHEGALDIALSQITDYVVNAKTSDQSLSSSTTMTDVTNISVSVAANTNYEFEVFCELDAASATPDMRFRMVAPASAEFVYIGQNNSGALSNNDSNTVYGDESIPSSTGTFVALGTSMRGSLSLRGTLRVAGTAGTFKLQFRQATSSADSITIKEGSWIRLREL